MNVIKLTDGQLEYLQELVMFAYEMEVPEQKGWDIQTYDNLVDAVMIQCHLNKCHKITPFVRVGFYNMYIPHKQGAIYA